MDEKTDKKKWAEHTDKLLRDKKRREEFYERAMKNSDERIKNYGKMHGNGIKFNTDVLGKAPEEKKKDMGAISDGYHTFDELYIHRNLLFLSFIKHSDRNSWWSRKHDDGTMFDNMIIVGLDMVRGPVTYHMEDGYVCLLKKMEITELDKAPKWDGHTSADVITRLLCEIQSLEFNFDMTREDKTHY